MRRLEPLIAAAALSFVLGASAKVWVAALWPQLATTCAYYRDARLHGQWPGPAAGEEDPSAWSPPAADPWGRPWKVTGMFVLAGHGVSYGVYSTGPNGRDEQGDGDDLWPTPGHGDRRWPDVVGNRPTWLLLHVDLLLMLGVPGALWWGSALARLWSSRPERLAREASLCVIAAGVPGVAVGWRLLRVPAPPAPPWLLVDPGLALAASGALGCVVVIALVRAWRRSRVTPSESAQAP